MCFLFYWIFSYTYQRDIFILQHKMKENKFTDWLVQIKEVVNNISNFSKTLEEMFSSWSTQEELENSKKNIDTKIIAEIKPEIKYLSDQIYEKERFKMIESLSQYIKSLLNTHELQNLSDIFSGKTLEEDIVGYLYEQQYILKEEEKWNLMPRQALKKSFQMYDSTKKIENILTNISSFYFKQQGIERLTKTEKYFKGKINTNNKPQLISVWESEIKLVENRTIKLPEAKILKNIVNTAKNEIWTSEKDGSADKYFKDLWYKHNSKKTPWCWAFVSWVLEENNIPTPKNNLSARAFIGEGGLWHVGIKVDGKVLSWNYGNKVSLATINKQIKWYAIPTTSGLDIINKKVELSEIPEWAIIVYERNAKRTQTA